MSELKTATYTRRAIDAYRTKNKNINIYISNDIYNNILECSNGATACEFTKQAILEKLAREQQK